MIDAGVRRPYLHGYNGGNAFLLQKEAVCKGGNMIICDHLGKEYGGRFVLEDFSFTFEPGHIYAILGPNGSGKSTLMKAIAGLVKPSAGGIYVNDHELTYEDKQFIAYMPTEAYFYNYMSAKQAARYYQDFFNDFQMEKFQWFMDQMRLNPDVKIRNYSTGMMAKFKVALNLSRNPQVLMLDEPLNGLDLIAREEVTAGIMQGITPNMIVMISSHQIEELERISDQVIFIREGSILVSGSTADFRQRYGKSMSDMYREIFGNVYAYPGAAPGMQGMDPRMQNAVMNGNMYGMGMQGQNMNGTGMPDRNVYGAGTMAQGVYPNGGMQNSGANGGEVRYSEASVSQGFGEGGEAHGEDHEV